MPDNMLDNKSLDLLFREARSQNAYVDAPISDDTLKALYDVWKYGPTSANCSPARVVFVRSEEGKAKLLPHLMGGNQVKTKSAAVCAIIGHDVKFYDRIPELFPHQPEAREWFCNDDNFAAESAFRNGSLQGAYLMIAARAMGLDVGPMSGFDPKGVEETFFPNSTVKVNFLCNLGQGDPSAVFERSPRLAFEDACTLA
jgi:3-hydroxypropanoate dehydrogenase